MSFAIQGFVSALCTADLRGQAPQTLYKAPAAFNARFRPFQIAFGRAVRQHEPAHGICAILIHNVIGIDDIFFRLGHFLDTASNRRRAAFDDGPDVALASHLIGAEPTALSVLIGLVRHHALRKQRRKGLLHVDQANMA